MFLNKAIELAIENLKNGGDPFGAVLVKDNEIIAKGVNELHHFPHVSGHAELLAITRAQELLNRTDLSDCILYASGHPCPMCLGAIGFSNIKKVIYSNTLEECADKGLGLSSDIYDYIKGAQTLDLELIHEPRALNALTGLSISD